MHVILNVPLNKIRSKTNVKKFLWQANLNPTSFFLQELMNLGFEYGARLGLSLSMEDLRAGNYILPLVRPRPTYANYILSVGEEAYRSSSVRLYTHRGLLAKRSLRAFAQFMNYFSVLIPMANSLYLLARTGARGSWSQARQLVGFRGFVSNAQGQLCNLPVSEGFAYGLRVHEYFLSCYGARKGIIDTALRTSESGHLTRKMVEVTQRFTITERQCLNPTIMEYPVGVNVTLTGHFKPLQSLILEGRYASESITDFKSHTVLLSNSRVLDNNTLLFLLSQNRRFVRLYSALSCEGLICQRCYGVDRSTGNIVKLGASVGTVAGQSVGEPGTQLVLRTFHTGGVFESYGRQQRSLKHKIAQGVCFLVTPACPTLHLMGPSTFNFSQQINRSVWYLGKTPSGQLNSVFNIGKFSIFSLRMLPVRHFLGSVDPRPNHKVWLSGDLDTYTLLFESGMCEHFVDDALPNNFSWICSSFPLRSLLRYTNWSKWDNIENISSLESGELCFLDLLLALTQTAYKGWRYSLIDQAVGYTKNSSVGGCCGAYGLLGKSALSGLGSIRQLGLQKFVALETFMEKVGRQNIYKMKQHIWTNKTYKSFSINSIIGSLSEKGQWLMVGHAHRLIYRMIWCPSPSASDTCLWAIRNKKGPGTTWLLRALKRNNAYFSKFATSGTSPRVIIYVRNKFVVNCRTDDFCLKTFEFRLYMFCKKTILSFKKFQRSSRLGNRKSPWISFGTFLRAYFYSNRLCVRLPKSSTIARAHEVFFLLTKGLRHQELLSSFDIDSIEHYLKWKPYSFSPFFLPHNYMFCKDVSNSPLPSTFYSYSYRNVNFGFANGWTGLRVAQDGFITQTAHGERLLLRDAQSIISLWCFPLLLSGRMFKLKCQTIGSFKLFGAVFGHHYKSSLVPCKTITQGGLRKATGFFLRRASNVYRWSGDNVSRLSPLTCLESIQLARIPTMREQLNMIVYEKRKTSIYGTKRSYPSWLPWVQSLEDIYRTNRPTVGSAQDIVLGIQTIESILEARAPVSSAWLAPTTCLIKKGYDQINNSHFRDMFTSSEHDQTGRHDFYLNCVPSGFSKCPFSVRWRLLTLPDNSKSRLKTFRLCYGGQPIYPGMASLHSLISKIYANHLYFNGLFTSSKLTLVMAQQVIARSLFEQYQFQGVSLPSVHFELIAKRMASCVRVVALGHVSCHIGDIVPLGVIHMMNQAATRYGYQSCLYRPLVLGLSKSMLWTAGFLSSSSFQDSIRILAKMSIRSAADWCHDLKARLMMGHLVPVGTGWRTISETSAHREGWKSPFEVKDVLGKFRGLSEKQSVPRAQDVQVGTSNFSIYAR